MTIRVGENSFLYDDTTSPPRIVGVKQPDGQECYFPFVTTQPSAYNASSGIDPRTAQPFTTTTTSALTAIANAINTTNKYAGKIVYNTTTGRYVQALNATAGGTWNSLADGTTAVHTPA